MSMNKRNFFAALAVAGVVAAGGSAFTAGNTVDDSVAGYGTSTVSGATASAVAHTLSGDGAKIVSTLITFTETQTGRTVTAGFGGTPLQRCAVAADGLTADCGYLTSYTTADATAFNVAVS